MSENYIVINGKKAELTEEQLEKLGIELEKNKPEEMFKRMFGELYHYIGDDGNVRVRPEYFNKGDDYLNDIGNYCKDENLMKQRALHETLNRLLWRASVIAGELDNPWDLCHYHYYIGKHYLESDIKMSGLFGALFSSIIKEPGLIYFPSREKAEAAINDIILPFLKEHPDFVW